MRPGNRLEEITIKVPAPFAGVMDLGFSARYPEQSRFAPLRDVPLWIEGPAGAVRRLAARLRMLAQSVDAAHGWSDPILLTDEVAVIAFQDRSGHGRGLADGAQESLDYVLNLVRPVVFPFLRDCVQVADLRLAERIDMSVRDAGREIAELSLRLEQIVATNGCDVLSD